MGDISSRVFSEMQLLEPMITENKRRFCLLLEIKYL